MKGWSNAKSGDGAKGMGMKLEIQYRTRSLGIERNKKDPTKTMQGDLVKTEVKLSLQAVWGVGTNATKKAL